LEVLYEVNDLIALNKPAGSSLEGVGRIYLPSRRNRHTKSRLLPFVVSQTWEPVAQLVEQRPFKPWVAGSNPARLTISEFDL
jgi:hypothetical protein